MKCLLSQKQQQGIWNVTLNSLSQIRTTGRTGGKKEHFKNGFNSSKWGSKCFLEEASFRMKNCSLQAKYVEVQVSKYKKGRRWTWKPNPPINVQKNAVKRIQNFFILLRVHKVGVKYVHIIHKTSCFQKQQLLNRFEYPFLFFLTLKIFLASSTAFGPLVILLDVFKQTRMYVN